MIKSDVSERDVIIVNETKETKRVAMICQELTQAKSQGYVDSNYECNRAADQCFGIYTSECPLKA